MGLLDFLFPTLMAVETRSKLKAEKEWKQEREQQRQEYAEFAQSVDICEKLYTDRYYEIEKIPNMIKRSHDDIMCTEDREFVFSDILEDCPSFDPERERDNEDITRCLFKGLGNKIALAKYYGKLPSTTFSMGSNCSYQARTDWNREWWGRREYNYKSQMFHELMQMWYLYMKQHDFPYELKVIDTVECQQDSPILRDEGVPVMCIENFKGGYLYYWDVPPQWKHWVYNGQFTNFPTVF